LLKQGQFVRQASNTDIISTGDGISEDEDDDPSSRNVEMVSSPEYWKDFPCEKIVQMITAHFDTTQ